MMGEVLWISALLQYSDREKNNTMSDELERILDALPGVAFTASTDGYVNYVSQGWQGYTGRQASEAFGVGWCAFVHPDDENEIRARWQEIFINREPADLQARLRRHDGAYRWFSLRLNPTTDPSTQAVSWCGLGSDIEDLRHVPSASAVHDPVTESIIDSIPGMVAFMTADGELEQVNRQIVDYLGLPFEVLKNWVTANTIHPEDLPSVISAWTYSVNTGVPYDVEIRLRRFDGVYHWFQVRGLPVRDHDGRIKRWCVLQVDVDEQKRDKALIVKAFAEVTASEDRLRNIIDAVPGFVWSAAPDGGVVFINKRWCDYTGLSLSEARGTGWTASVHPSDAAELAAYWTTLLACGEAGEFEARIRRYDGAYRWFLIRAVPQRDEAGNVMRWYGENTDIEDRKQTEILLAGEKHLLGMIANGSPLPDILAALSELVEVTFAGCYCSIVLVDLKQPPLSTSTGTTLRLQPGAAPHVPPQLLPGLDGKPVDGRRCPVATAASLNEPVIAADLTSETRWTGWRAEALDQGMGANWSLPINSSGHDVTGVLSILWPTPNRPTHEQQNLIAQFTHLASIAIDRVRSEAALRQSEAFLAKAQRLSATGTFYWRVSTDEVIWSDEIYRILEVPSILRPNFNSLHSRIHPDDVSIHKEIIRRQRRNGGDFEHEHRLLMPDGSVKHVHLVAHAIKDVDGELEYIAALQDITQRRLSEEALAKIRSELAHLARVASLGAVTASIAHEVNQPLAGIITNASTCLRMLGADPPNVEGARETARRTIRDGNRASDVINRLRALFSKKSITIENVDINEATREVVAMLLSELQRNSVVLHPEFADNLLPVKGDRVQLQQVILNLILNAIEALNPITGRSRQMSVTTRMQDDQSVYFAVTDNGSGFDPQDAARMFNAFYTTKRSGMGIGLSISLSIIERHEGTLWASVNDGPGATVQFSIPTQTTHDETAVDDKDDHKALLDSRDSRPTEGFL
jgi:PAS domain S-box-containing protein